MGSKKKHAPLQKRGFTSWTRGAGFTPFIRATTPATAGAEKDVP